MNIKKDTVALDILNIYVDYNASCSTGYFSSHHSFSFRTYQGKYRNDKWHQKKIFSNTTNPLFMTETSVHQIHPYLKQMSSASKLNQNVLCPNLAMKFITSIKAGVTGQSLRFQVPGMCNQQQGNQTTRKLFWFYFLFFFSMKLTRGHSHSSWGKSLAPGPQWQRCQETKKKQTTVKPPVSEHQKWEDLLFIYPEEQPEFHTITQSRSLTWRADQRFRNFFLVTTIGRNHFQQANCHIFGNSLT